MWAFVLLALPGCDALHVQERIVPPERVGGAVERVTGMSLTYTPPPNRSNMVNLLATFGGRDERRAVTVLVFDGRQATVQATGRTRGRAPDPDSVAIKDRNVLVFYRGDAPGRQALVQALASLRGVAEDKVLRDPTG